MQSNAIFILSALTDIGVGLSSAYPIALGPTPSFIF